MNGISGINKGGITNPTTRAFAWASWESLRDFASILSSREPFYRVGLDITGFDLPLMVADLFRGFKKFLESSLEAFTGTVMVGASPYITTFVGRILGKFMFKGTDLKEDPLNYLKFSMAELRDPEKFKTAAERMRKEEIEDKTFLELLYARLNYKKKANDFNNEKKEIERFCKDFKPTDENRKLIYKLKKATIIAESFLEGGFWGGYGLIMRAFRKYVLREDRFTGTKGYLSDTESQRLGEGGGLTWFQKIVGVAAMFIAPALNAILLNKIENREAVKNSKFLQIVDRQLDMTHGVYPKLGLLFTQTTIPKWIGTITLSQGWFERIERILKLFTVIPSWWCGHMLTNGTIALKADKELAKKHNVNPGILVEPEYLEPVNEHSSLFERLTKRFPEPARIHHVMKSTEGEGKEVLQKEAEDLHAKCLYKGFALHSLLVFGINLIVNHITKLRALRAAGR